MVARDCTLASPELAPRTGRRALPPYRTGRTPEPLCRPPSPGGALLHPHGALTLSPRVRPPPPGPLTRAACRLDRLWDLRFAVLSGHTLSVYRRSDLGADGRGAEAGLNEVQCRASGRAAANGVA